MCEWTLSVRVLSYLFFVLSLLVFLLKYSWKKNVMWDLAHKRHWISATKQNNKLALKIDVNAREASYCQNELSTMIAEKGKVMNAMLDHAIYMCMCPVCVYECVRSHIRVCMWQSVGQIIFNFIFTVLESKTVDCVYCERDWI